MGAYLSEPVVKKENEEGEGNFLRFGAAAMQGWRVSQEDAHNCVLNFDGEKKASLFSVYDGHGGAEVAIYLARHFPDILKATEHYTKGEWEEALKEAFLKIDGLIKTPPVLAEIQKIAKSASGDEKEGLVDYEEDDVGALYEEATMPLAELVAKYATNKLKEKAEAEAAAAGSSSDLPGSSECPGSSSNGPGPSSSTSPGSSKSVGNSIAETVEPDSSEGCAEVKEPIVIAKEAYVTGEISSTNGTEVKNEVKNEVEESTVKNGVKESNEPDSTEDKCEAEAKVNGTSEAEPIKEEQIAPLENSIVLPSSEDGAEPVRRGKKLPPSPQEMNTVVRKSPRKIDEKKVMEAFLNEVSDSESESDESANVSKETEDTESDDEDNENSSESDESSDDDDDEDDDDDDDETDGHLFKDLQEPGFDSGSTAVVAFIYWENEIAKLFVANAGDSRCVVCRSGEAKDMSSDHKPEDDEEALRIVKAGGRVTADGRVNGGLNLSRAIGDHSYKQSVGLPPEAQMISALPDVKCMSLQYPVDEFVVLACDGIWNSLTSQEVVDFIRPRLTERVPLTKICNELFDVCLAGDTNGDGTGCDNMTMIIVQLLGPELESQKRQRSPEPSEGNEIKRAKVEQSIE